MIRCILFFLFLFALAQASPDAALKAKVEKKISELNMLSTDPNIIKAVKTYNQAPASSMTNEQWKTLNLLSPEVKTLAQNELATYLKSKRTPEIAEFFVNGADGGKVAFLSKPSNWTHKGKPKHEQPMQGKTWIGDAELDESTGKQLIQFSIPVLDNGKPIGSIVIGLSVTDLK